MKEYAPRKVFILANGEYIELTNEEFERRKASDRGSNPKQGYLYCSMFSGMVFRYRTRRGRRPQAGKNMPGVSEGSAAGGG